MLSRRRLRVRGISLASHRMTLRMNTFSVIMTTPWDINDRYILCMRARDTWSDVSPKEKSDILQLIDTALLETNKNRIREIAETSSWNVQQGCMLQWLGPDFSSRILFNDYRNGKYVSVIKEVNSGVERKLLMLLYTRFLLM